MEGDNPVRPNGVRGSSEACSFPHFDVPMVPIDGTPGIVHHAPASCDTAYTDPVFQWMFNQVHPPSGELKWLLASTRAVCLLDCKSKHTLLLHILFLFLTLSFRCTMIFGRSWLWVWRI